MAEQEDNTEFQQFEDETKKLAVRAAYEIIREVVIGFKDIPITDIARVVIKAIGKIETIRRAANKVWRERHPDDDDNGLYFDAEHVAASALWAASNDFEMTNDIDELNAECIAGTPFVGFASAIILLEKKASLENSVAEISDGGLVMELGNSDDLLGMINKPE